MTVATTWQKNMGRGLCEGKTENSFYLVIITDVRNLHVMTKFEVGCKLQGLRHRDVAPGLEHHHSNRATRERITNDELGDDIEANLLVGDGLDNTDWNDVHECNDLQKNVGCRTVREITNYALRGLG